MGSPARPTSALRKPVPQEHVQQEASVVPADSGYYGSQSQDVELDLDVVMQEAEPSQSPSLERTAESPQQFSAASAETVEPEQAVLPANSLQETSQSAEEEDAKSVDHTEVKSEGAEHSANVPVEPSSPVQLLGSVSPEQSPAKSSPPMAQAEQHETVAKDQDATTEAALETATLDDDGEDVTRSPSDGSSPMRPLVRKSSLNFASLPAREPMTSNKSLGTRVSRTSHFDQTRTSYYPRQTGGKSIGVRQDELEHEEDAMDVDDATELVGDKDSVFTAHGKTYTQRLQDQISMLGKSQAGGTRPSKSIHNSAGTQLSYLATQPVYAVAEQKPLSPPPRNQKSSRTPGAFPQDDEDDWIAPPTTTKKLTFNPSPRPGLAKSHSADVIEGLRGNGPIGLDKRRDHLEESQLDSPLHSPQKPTVSHPGQMASHTKSISVPDMRQNIFGRMPGQDVVRKGVSVSNPVVESGRNGEMAGAPKSPTKSVRESPAKHNALKQVKNKFSSILKGSKGLLASSAALSAESKASLRNSPSIVKMHSQFAKSVETLETEEDEAPLYPDLSKHMSSESQPVAGSTSPVSRKTRASSERDKRDQKQKEKEDKHARLLAEQVEKLERAREVEREKARQEKIALEKQVVAQNEQERNTRTPAPRAAPKPTRTSPRKAQALTETQTESKPAAEIIDNGAAELDVEMADVPTSKPTPSIPRPTATPGQAMKMREMKRPMKPTREATVKTKQAPTLIRVNTSSQHGGFHPSNSALSSTLHETLNNPQPPAKTKTVQAKSSVQSLNSSINSTTGRPKALELADKRRQEEEKKAQRKRELKAEMERKREEARKVEEERREKERQRSAAEEEAKKTAARQAAIERAKHTKAPPPAHRSQPNGPLGNSSVREKASVSRPPSRLGQSTMHRTQEDVGRPVNAVLSTTASKLSVKRPLQQDGAEDGATRPVGARGGPTHQKDAKRMRMSDEFDPEEQMEIQSYGSNLKGPPVRPSAGFKKVSHPAECSVVGAAYSLTFKDQPNKSLFAGGYAQAPQGVTRDIFKAPPVAAHHSKSGQPMDMAQLSKGHIPFASSQNGVGPSTHKTPARPAAVLAAKSAAKSAKRSSPRVQNGDNIELPEIQTDDEDEDDEDEAKGLGIASWVDTPELRRELMRQETLDPLQVFGPPAPLKLEEVFKNKDRWNKFRSRGSSANWGGTDRLTEEEIRKDMAAREKMRRDGGWSYELSKDMR